MEIQIWSFMELHISVFIGVKWKFSYSSTSLVIIYGIGNHLFILFVVLVVCYFIARIKVVRACCFIYMLLFCSAVTVLCVD